MNTNIFIAAVVVSGLSSVIAVCMAISAYRSAKKARR